MIYPGYIQFKDRQRFYNHVLAIGQSLAGGAWGIPVLNPTPKYATNLMFDPAGQAGVLHGTDMEIFRTTELPRLVPLKAQVSPHSVLMGESHLVGFANYLTSKLGPGVHDLLCSNTGVGSSAYNTLSKTGTAISGITRSGSTATVTCATDHNLATGMRVIVSGADQPEYNVSAIITKLSATTFSYTVSGTPATPATGTMRWRTLHYERGLDHVRRAKMLLGNQGYTFGALLAVHGEGDYNNASFDTDMRTWQADYEADIQALTGQAATIPALHSQISSWSQWSATTALSPYLLLDEFKANPTKTILVCPKYFLPYAQDGLHLNATGYQWLGEYYGKAYHQHVINGAQFSPLYPTTVSRTGAEILVTFATALGQLVLDTARVSDPGDYGFEFYDDGGPSASIVDVRLAGANQVRVILDAAPTGGSKALRYAYTAVAGALAGVNTGPRGCLRDSDPTLGPSKMPLFNWCTHFNETVA